MNADTAYTVNLIQKGLTLLTRGHAFLIQKGLTILPIYYTPF